jgi:DNA invertase Pin-like site-specific DNA recombinase
MTVRAYVGVSTAEQRCELQVRELREYAERLGWQMADIYEDANSGAKASRPALNRLIADARARKFDCLLVWKLDRFGRSLVDCLKNIKILEENGIRFIAVTQRLDTDLQNPASRFLLHVLGAAAEFERALIRERTKAGLTRYKLDFESWRVGKTVYSRSGRNLPPHRPTRVFDRNEVLRLRRQGWSYRQIANYLDWGLSSGRCSRVPKARRGDLEQRRRPGTIASEWRHPLTISKHYATIIF